MTIIYEEEDFLVLDKPSGVVVHPDAHHKKDTLVDRLLKERPQIKGVGEEGRDGIVHRLDKGTSGVILIAKTQKGYKKLKDLFKKREVKKTYLSLVHGDLKAKKGEISYPIYTSPGHFPKRQALKDEKRGEDIGTTIRKAQTEYEVIRSYDKYTYCRIYPKTGRTHQIRVHMKAIGHPVIGDDLYRFKDLEKPAALKRIFLHAARISFRLKGSLYEFESELPDELSEFLGKILVS